MKKKSSPRASAEPKAKANLGPKLLEAILQQVVFDGWTETAYEAALKQTGLSPSEAKRIMPEGVLSAVEQFGEQIDQAMQKRIKAQPGFARMRVRDKIALAVRARFEAMGPHRDAMRRLMVWYAMPHHAAQGLKRLYQTVDMIWQAAGDTSTDYNFYTKRLLLAGVMKATMLFWLNDSSPNQTATADFLERRIGDVMKLGKGISLLKEYRPNELAALLRDKLYGTFSAR